MRRSTLLLSLVGGLIVGASMALPSPAKAQVSPLGAGGPTGTYLVKFIVGRSALLGVGTLHRDGTWTMSDQTDFGGVPGLDSKQSPWHGTWKFIGARRAKLVAVCFNFHANGAPKGAQRIEGILDFAPGFGSAKGVTSQRVYGLTENPLDPTAGKPAAPFLNGLPVVAQKMVK